MYLIQVYTTLRDTKEQTQYNVKRNNLTPYNNVLPVAVHWSHYRMPFL